MKSFTLIELIVYIAIVAVILILASGFAWNIIHGDIKAMVYREVQQNARFAMEKMTRAIRDGQDPLVIFTNIGGILYQNGIALTTDQIRVTNLSFTLIDNTYKINLSIAYYNPDNRPEYEASVDMESTALARQ